MTLHHITSRHITSHHVTSHHVTSHHITSHHITPRYITSRYITSRHLTSRYIISHHVTSHHITLHHITSHHFTSHHVTSHHVTSHHIHDMCIYIYIQIIWIIYMIIPNRLYDLSSSEERCPLRSLASWRFHFVWCPAHGPLGSTRSQPPRTWVSSELMGKSWEKWWERDNFTPKWSVKFEVVSWATLCLRQRQICQLDPNGFWVLPPSWGIPQSTTAYNGYIDP